VFVAAVGCGRLNFETQRDAPDGPCNPATWSAPIEVTELASGLATLDAQITADGLALYFRRDSLLNVARRPDRASSFGTPQALSELGATMGSPTISRDEREMYVESEQSGSSCIYRTTRAAISDPWGTPSELTALCIPLPAGGPYLTADGLRLYYHTVEAASCGEILMSTRASLADTFGPGVSVPGAGNSACYPSLPGNELEIMFQHDYLPVDVVLGVRADTSSPFVEVALDPDLNAGDSVTNTSFTEDGKELFFSWGGAPDRIYTLRRGCQ